MLVSAMTRFIWSLRARASLLAGLGALVCVSRDGQAQRVTYSGSLQFATGDYLFSARTSSLYLANGISFTSGRWRGSLTVPVVAQDGGWVQYSGGGVIPSGGMRRDANMPNNAERHGEMMSLGSNSGHGELGLGDPILRADLDLVRSRTGTVNLRLTSAVKAPVASVETGFGTGAWDAGAGLSYAQSLANTFLFGDAMFWKLGDGPRFALRDVVSYAVGVGRPLPGRRLAVLASVLGATSFLRGVPAPLQLGGGLSYRSPDGRGMSLSGLVGITRSAPELAIALGWQVPLS